MHNEKQSQPQSGKEEDDILLVRKEYEAKLRSHDWYYHYSDDGRSYRAGEASYTALGNLRKRYAALAGQEAADELWDQLCPADFKLKR